MDKSALEILVNRLYKPNNLFFSVEDILQKSIFIRFVFNTILKLFKNKAITFAYDSYQRQHANHGKEIFIQKYKLKK